MRIDRKRIATSIVLIATLLLSSITSIAQTSTDWSRLNTIASDSKLAVKLKNGKTINGKLSSVTDSALSLTVKKKPVEIRREEVLTVHQLNKKSIVAPTLIGAGAGAGLGAAAGAAGGDDDNGFPIVTKGQLAAGLAVIGAGMGAVAGYFIGRDRKKRVLIYQAGQP